MMNDPYMQKAITEEYLPSGSEAPDTIHTLPEQHYPSGSMSLTNWSTDTFGRDAGIMPPFVSGIGRSHTQNYKNR